MVLAFAIYTVTLILLMSLAGKAEAEDLLAPLKLAHFNETGGLEGDLKPLIDFIDEGKYTDVYVISHGWNRNRDEAKDFYNEWINGYIKLTKEKEPEEDRGNPHEPVFVGVTWPSKWPFLDDDLKRFLRDLQQAHLQEGTTHDGEEMSDKQCSKEIGEKMNDEQRSEDEKKKLVEAMAAYVDDQNRDDFKKYCLQEHMLSYEEAFFLYKCLSSLPIDGDEIKARAVDSDVGENVLLAMPPMRGLPFHEYINPLNWIRMASFWEMRERAGVVGRNGVHELLKTVLDVFPQVRLHLIGHSFGAEVLLAAVSTGMWPEKRKKVSSMLLLQPAVVNSVFDAATPPKTPIYREAFSRVESPIVSTFSKWDLALCQLFHLAAIWPPEKLKPKPFHGIHFPIPFLDGYRLPDSVAKKIPTCALGGYPPTNLSASEFCILDPCQGEPYKFGSHKLCAICMDEEISDHFEVANRDTYYLLHALASRTRHGKT